MIRGGTQNLTTAPWISVFPGIAILITVLAFNLLGDGMRDIMDPKSYS
jgi:peptide/nickel transport system permease protein